MIICAIIRISAIRTEESIDTVWGVFWFCLSACIGLTMTAATAFRSLFIAHQQQQHKQEKRSKSTSTKRYWPTFTSLKVSFRRSPFVRSHPSKIGSLGHTDDASKDSGKKQDIELGNVEHATITGLQSFTRDYGQQTTSASRAALGQPRDEIEKHNGVFTSVDVTPTTTSTRSLEPDNGGICGKCRKHGFMQLEDEGEIQATRKERDNNSKILVTTEFERHHETIVSQENDGTGPTTRHTQSSNGKADRNEGAFYPNQARVPDWRAGLGWE